MDEGCTYTIINYSIYDKENDRLLLLTDKSDCNAHYNFGIRASLEDMDLSLGEYKYMVCSIIEDHAYDNHNIIVNSIKLIDYQSIKTENDDKIITTEKIAAVITDYESDIEFEDLGDYILNWVPIDRLMFSKIREPLQIIIDYIRSLKFDEDEEYYGEELNYAIFLLKRIPNLARYRTKENVNGLIDSKRIELMRILNRSDTPDYIKDSCQYLISKLNESRIC